MALPESRYGAASTTSVPAYGQPATGAVASTAGSSTTISGVPSFDAPAPSATPTPPSAPETVNQLVNGPSSRYGDQAAGAMGAAADRYGEVAGAAAVTTGAADAVRTAPYAVATTVQPYRPGGTATYPSTIGGPTQAPVQVATRPTTATTGTTSGGATTAPGGGQPGATPSTTPTPGAATPTRYW
jgi:hypothetical protein